MTTTPNDNTIDFKIEKNSQGVFDLLIEDGQFVTQNSLDTAIKMSVLSERRADASEQPVNSLRRGWWGNELSTVPGFEIGSKLWLLYQSPRTTETLNLSEKFDEDGLSWLVEDEFFEKVLASSIFIDNGIKIDTKFFKNNNVVETRSFEIVNNTGVS